MLSKIKSRRAIILVASIALVALLLGASTWVLLYHSPSDKQSSTTGTATKGTQHKATPVPTSIPVSPLLFGTNMGLFDANDQVLNSAVTRSLLQKMHARIIRMPIRTTLSDATETQAAQIIKSLGAIPLVVLHGELVSDPLTIDTHVINVMNSVFGKNIVYYEFGNEEDLNGVPVDRYTARWNQVVPQLKRVALNGHFIGPVNYQYDRNYLMTFLQNARPQPDEISWHEYTCDDSWATDVCIAHIDRWTTHISDARAVMTSVLGKTLPIMITEWNYAPNAVSNDGKNNNSSFMTAWTTKALQTLAANRVFASMQYSCTNTAIPLIDTGNALTAQGAAFQTIYQQIIVNGQQPAAVSATPPAQPTLSASTTTPSSGNAVFSFEDGTTDGWSAHGNGIVNVQNSATVAMDGTHSLQVTLTNTSSGDFPYISAGLSNLPSSPHAGQTVTAYVYVSSNSVSLTAKLFVADANYQWHTGDTINLAPGTWNRVSYTLPSDLTGQLRQVGIQFNSTTSSGVSSNVYVDAVGW